MFGSQNKLVRLGLFAFALLSHAKGYASNLILSVDPAQPRSFCPTCVPHAATLNLRVAAGPDGKGAVSQVHVALRHVADSLILSSGFPYMEGATLFEGTFTLAQGSLSAPIIFPIRGDYVLSADLLQNGAATDHAELRIHVKDAVEMQRNFFAFVVILLGLGLLAGWIFGRRNFTATMGLFLLLSVIPTKGVWAHNGKEHAPKPVIPQAMQKSGEWTADCTIGPGEVVVGTPAKIHFKLGRADGKPLKGSFKIGLKVNLEEDNVDVLASELFSPDGTLDLSYGFFDGSDHSINFLVVPSTGGTSADFSFKTSVTARQPPAAASRKAFVFLMGLFCAGLVIGLFAAKSRAET